MAKQSVLVPVLVFAGLVILLGFGFRLSDPSYLPSQKLGEPLPEFRLPNLLDESQWLTEADFLGEPFLLNVWATWCPSCLAEHDALTSIRQQHGVRIMGINYNDDPIKARRWLQDLGDPYDYHVIDAKGTLAVDLGVYGAPETFVVGADGTILYRHVGVVTEAVFEETLANRLLSAADQL
jgi:cytochrome c biogenesis protein CcmG/thiol:disulfide interchange protein DsbE